MKYAFVFALSFFTSQLFAAEPVKAPASATTKVAFAQAKAASAKAPKAPKVAKVAKAAPAPAKAASAKK